MIETSRLWREVVQKVALDYPDVEVEHQFVNHPKIQRVVAPIMEISSTFIRKQHKAGKNIRPLLPEGVFKYMDEMNFYRK